MLTRFRGEALVLHISQVDSNIQGCTFKCRMGCQYTHPNITYQLRIANLDKSRADNQRVAKLATIREASSFKRRDAVMETGWATMPGTDGPNRDLAQACIEGLDLDAS